LGLLRLPSGSTRGRFASRNDTITTMSHALELVALAGMPMVREGDDIAALIIAALDRRALRDGDVLVVAQKIVSKAEGRTVDLATVEPSAEAVDLAHEVGKDPRLVEAVLRESTRVVRSRPNLIIVQHRLGFVMANAGVDQSNVAPADGVHRVLLLPLDPDASAEALRTKLQQHFNVSIGVVISDSFGRAWRRGTCGIAIGAAGLPSLIDLRGQPDLFGRTLEVSVIGFADEIAAAASLLQGQAAEAQPVVLVRGLNWSAPVAPAAELIRPPQEDLFR
jgi:coenzyme F420-0:L-glutamate ligase / coenzyme F420-1:gamma-L-glutamate ligase